MCNWGSEQVEGTSLILSRRSRVGEGSLEGTRAHRKPARPLGWPVLPDTDQRVSGTGGPPAGQLPCRLAAPRPSPREASLQGQCQESREAKMLPQAHPEHVHIKLP